MLSHTNFSPTDSSLIDLYADAGIEFIGLNEARPNDKFGIAAGYAHFSRHALGHFPPPDPGAISSCRRI
jgi:carbohydrate-selective porin OprB